MSHSTGNRRVAIVGAALLAGAAMVAALPAGAAAAPKMVTVYSVVKSQQFVSNADDRQRGSANNPFAVDTSAQGNDSAGATGPFPGDAAVSFNQLYTGPDLLKTAGTASSSCDFVFHRNAICKMTVQLAGGTIVVVGATLFGSKSFALAVTGGTGKYRSAHGELRVGPAVGTGAQVAQKFTFVLD